MKTCDMVIRDTEKGKAVFAEKEFPCGEVICEFTGPTYTKEEYLSLHDPCNNHFLQIDEEHFIGPSHGADDLINHSCNPNCGLEYNEGKIFLTAIRDIARGEELTFDYSTTMDEDCWEMECLCGDALCRKTVRDFKHLPRQVQLRYIALGVVPSYIVRKINFT